MPLLCLVGLLIVACHRMSDVNNAAQDARDVAWVEATQKVHPPVQLLEPQPMNQAVRRLYRMTASGCEFLPSRRRSNEPIFVVGRAKAMLRVLDEPMVFAADAGSPELASGVHAKFTGRAFWAELASDPGSLTIYDRWDRVVYVAAGRLTCHG